MGQIAWLRWWWGNGEWGEWQQQCTETELLPHFPILRQTCLYINKHMYQWQAIWQIARVGGVEITVCSNRSLGHTMSLASAVSGTILEFHKESCSVNAAIDTKGILNCTNRQGWHTSDTSSYCYHPCSNELPNMLVPTPITACGKLILKHCTTTTHTHTRKPF